MLINKYLLIDRPFDQDGSNSKLRPCLIFLCLIPTHCVDKGATRYLQKKSFGLAIKKLFLGTYLLDNRSR